jgi:hypothetical protein
MTDDSIALRALLEKSAEADLLREAGPRATGIRRSSPRASRCRA